MKFMRIIREGAVKKYSLFLIIDKKDFPKLIQKLSPDFCEIYNQAYIAQQQGSTKISGIGYRKALEFLVKDYVIFLNPNESVNIKSFNLSSCISKYIKKIQYYSFISLKML